MALPTRRGLFGAAFQKEQQWVLRSRPRRWYGADGFYYREEHEWREVAPDAQAKFSLSAQQISAYITKASSNKDDGDLTAVLEASIDGVAQPVLSVTGVSRRELKSSRDSCTASKRNLSNSARCTERSDSRKSSVKVVEIRSTDGAVTVQWIAPSVGIVRYHERGGFGSPFSFSLTMRPERCGRGVLRGRQHLHAGDPSGHAGGNVGTRP